MARREPRWPETVTICGVECDVPNADDKIPERTATTTDVQVTIVYDPNEEHPTLVWEARWRTWIRGREIALRGFGATPQDAAERVGADVAYLHARTAHPGD